MFDQLISSTPRIAATVLSAAFLASTADAESQLLSDPGLDSDSQALLGFTTNNVYNRWLVESASLVTGTQNGVTPFAGDGMIRITQASLSLTEIRQRVDVSAIAASIDAGLVRVEASIMINPTIAGVSSRSRIIAVNGTQTVELANVTDPCFAPDGDVTTWEKSALSIAVPPGTRFLEIRPFASNSTLPAGESVYMDDAQLNVYIDADDQVLTDAGFNSTTAPLLPFTTNFLYDHWLEENAQLVVGPDNGVTPFEGDGMIRVAQASLSISEIRQRVDVSSFASTIDAGLMSLSASMMINPTIPGVNTKARALAFDASQAQLVFESDTCFEPDGDVTTWEKSSLIFALPPGTRFVEIRPSASNATLPAGEYVYMDDANIALIASPVCVTDICPGLAGTSGAPELGAQILLDANAVGELQLRAALPNSPAVLFVGLGPAGPGAAFKGGTLKPATPLLLLTFSGLTTDATGAINVGLPLDPHAGPFSFVLQYAVQDAGAIFGVSLSNAVQLDVY